MSIPSLANSTYVKISQIDGNSKTNQKAEQKESIRPLLKPILKPILQVPPVKESKIPIRHAIYQKTTEEKEVNKSTADKKAAKTVKTVKTVKVAKKASEKVTEEAEKVTEEAEKVTEEAEKVTEKIIEKAEKAQKAAEKTKPIISNLNNWNPTKIDRTKLGNVHIVASFDIGITHLAYSVICMEITPSDSKITLKKFKVFDWGIINLIGEDTENICNHFMSKAKKCCGKKASFYLQPEKSRNESKEANEKGENEVGEDEVELEVNEVDFANIDIDELGEDHVEFKTYLCGTHAKMYSNAKPIPPGIRADSVPIQTLCLNMVQKLDEYPIFLDVDEVLIEEQPTYGSGSRPFFKKGANFSSFQQSPKVHPRMKNLSYMIYSYFIMRGIVPKNLKELKERSGKLLGKSEETPKEYIKAVKFINSNNKLKLYDGPEINLTQKSPYARNKAMAQHHLRYILRGQPELLHFFETYKKKDDLADCFLQGAWYLKRGLTLTSP